MVDRALFAPYSLPHTATTQRVRLRLVVAAAVVVVAVAERFAVPVLDPATESSWRSCARVD